MTSKPVTGLPASTTLGATLLGLSATLFAVDVGGTFFLEHRNSGANAVEQSARQPAHIAAIDPVSRTFSGSHASERSAVRESNVTHVAVHQSVNQIRRFVVPAYGIRQSHAVATGAPRNTSAHDARANTIHTADRMHAATLVALARTPAQTTPPARVRRSNGTVTLAAAKFFAKPVVQRRASAVAHGRHSAPPLATLREVRHFVMRQLAARQRHTCVVSAMTYSAGNGHVIVDLIVRNDRARWSEKAVVRRDGSSIKLLGVKTHELPFTALALAGVGQYP